MTREDSGNTQSLFDEARPWTQVAQVQRPPRKSLSFTTTTSRTTIRKRNTCSKKTKPSTFPGSGTMAGSEPMPMLS